MAIKLNKSAYNNALRLIHAGEVESFDKNWNEEKPDHNEIIEFIDNHSIQEYGLWYLGKNDKFQDNTKEHYVYPYGDLKEVQKSALVDTQKQAEKNGDAEIANAAKELLNMLNKK